MAVVNGSGGGIYVSESIPMAVLSVVPAGINLVLSWVIPSVEFVLQENSDLNTSNWMDVTNTAMLNLTNLQYQVLLSPPSGDRFYRLKH